MAWRLLRRPATAGLLAMTLLEVLRQRLLRRDTLADNIPHRIVMLREIMTYKTFIVRGASPDAVPKVIENMCAAGLRTCPFVGSIIGADAERLSPANT